MRQTAIIVLEAARFVYTSPPPLADYTTVFVFCGNTITCYYAYGKYARKEKTPRTCVGWAYGTLWPEHVATVLAFPIRSRPKDLREPVSPTVYTRV